MLNDEVIKKIFYGPQTNCLPNLIKQLHFNPKYPENHNIRIRNKNNKFGEMFINNKKG